MTDENETPTIDWGEFSDEDLKTALAGGLKELKARDKKAKANKKPSEMSDEELSQALERATKKG